MLQEGATESGKDALAQQEQAGCRRDAVGGTIFNTLRYCGQKLERITDPKEIAETRLWG